MDFIDQMLMEELEGTAAYNRLIAAYELDTHYEVKEWQVDELQYQLERIEEHNPMFAHVTASRLSRCSHPTIAVRLSREVRSFFERFPNPKRAEERSRQALDTALTFDTVSDLESFLSRCRDFDNIKFRRNAEQARARFNVQSAEEPPIGEHSQVRQNTMQASMNSGTTTGNSLQERIEQIKQCKREGLTTAEEIGKRLGLKPSTVHVYARKGEINLPRPKMTSQRSRKMPSQNTLEKIEAAIAKNPSSIEEICRQAGDISPVTLWGYRKEMNFSLEGLKPYRANPKIDTLIDKGRTLQEMSNLLGLSREYYSQYIHGTGQHTYWREKREERKKEPQRKKEAISRLFSLLKKRVAGLNWVNQKTIEYLNSKTRNIYPVEDIVRLFQTYEDAKIRGEKLSLEEIGETVNMHYTLVGRIFSTVGVEPMYGNINRKVSSKEQKLMMHRSFGLPLSVKDIAYFIGVNGFVVSQRYEKIGKRGHRGIYLSRHARITFRLASQVYEADDAGMEEEDICDVLGIKSEVYRHIVEYREELETRIISALRIIYGNPNLERPYKMAASDAQEGRLGSIDDFAVVIGSKARKHEVVDIPNAPYLSQEQEEMIERAVKLKMNCVDIAYFVGTSQTSVYNRAPNRGRKIFYLSQHRGRKITYRLVSQTFELMDNGNSDDSICDRLSISSGVLKYIVNNRQRFEPPVIDSLRVILADPNHNKPYKK